MEATVNAFHRSVSTQEEKGMKLTQVSYDRIMAVGVSELFDLSQAAGIQDDARLSSLEDLRVRLTLIKRKMEGSSHKWKHLFRSVQEETQLKMESLVALMKTVESTFQTIPTDPLSEVLRKEGHLNSPNLLQELSKRMKNLMDRRSLVVIAGETNGGKSTFLNLLLGEDILPTDVLHCTFVVCKIVYSKAYSVKTVDHNDREECFPCSTREEVRNILKNKAAEQEMKKRVHGSHIKEIIVGLPADILMSGVTLVDTPGIGEDENMDTVTMNFVKSTHASAFIYIIKSDAAGGVREDRLLNFLRAIKDRYSEDKMVEAFDPQAAMFICHRWDNIKEEQREKVKKNALNKLEYVWPGFQPSQTYFFSTTDAMKHLPADPEFVTDNFMMLLKGLKHLFDLASHNAIKHQYIWLKYMLQPASRHLRSMITHCIHSNEELDGYFKNVAVKQNKLMASSEANSQKLQTELNNLSQGLKTIISGILNFDTISPIMEIHDTSEIIEMCSRENFLANRSNRRMLDEMIIQSLLKHVDEHVHERKLVNEMDSTILTAIQEHLGLFKCQISQIKHDMLHGGNQSFVSSPSSVDLDIDDKSIQFGATTASIKSTASNNSSVDSFSTEITLDPSQLASRVKNLLEMRKNGKSRRSFNSKHEIQESLLSKFREKLKVFLPKTDPNVYVEERIRKVAKHIREDNEIMDCVVQGYTEWIQQCVNYATQSIPKFIDVNNKLMDEIREHRGVFQRDKDLFLKVMEDLEPSRHNLRGYGLLYMDDINAEMLAFNMEHRTSSVFVPIDLVADHKKNDDSGFQGSGSRNRKVQKIAKCLWARMQGATIKIDDVSEKVVVKTYIYDMDEKMVLSEIASLRCLDDTNLASFLGMTRIATTGSTRNSTFSKSEQPEITTEKISAFIFKGDLVSARVYSNRKTVIMQSFLPKLVDSLLQGLNFLHREGLVHMELNLDTVMVERITGAVKLCQMCKPREARFPASLNTITKSCVCLSPSVLQGHEYESTDDIYAFGLLLWELLFPDKPPYKEQRVWTLKKFIEECHPINMLQESLMSLNVSVNVREVLKGTLLISRRTVCMPISTVQSFLVDISNEPSVCGGITRPDHKAKQDEVSLSLHEEKPQRPPRKKDLEKVKSVSVDESGNKSPKNVPVPKPTRRQSEPAVSVISPSSPMIKSKKQRSIWSRMFDGGSAKALPDEESDDSASRSSSPVSKIAGNQAEALAPVQFVIPIKPKVHPRSSNAKEALVPPKPQPRRLSLQDQCLFVPKSVNLKRIDSIDVPSLMAKKFSSSLGKTMSKDNDSPAKPVTYFRSASSNTGSMPSLLLDDIKNSDAGSRGRSFPNNGRSISKSRPSSEKFLKVSTSSEYVPPGSSSKGILWLDPKRRTSLRQRFGGSLQDLSNGSVDHISHAIGPIMEDKIETSSLQQDTTTNPHQANLNVRNTSEYLTQSTPSIIIQGIKTLIEIPYKVGDDVVLQDFASSHKDLRYSEDTGKILSTGAHGQGLQTLNGIRVDCSSEDEIVSSSVDINIIDTENNKVYTRSHSSPVNHFTDTLKSLGVSRGSHITGEDDAFDALNVNTNTDQRGYSSEGAGYFSLGSSRDDSDNSIQNHGDSQQSGTPKCALPPPPQINFSKLSFGSSDNESDDEGFPSD